MQLRRGWRAQVRAQTFSRQRDRERQSSGRKVASSEYSLEASSGSMHSGAALGVISQHSLARTPPARLRMPTKAEHVALPTYDIMKLIDSPG